MKRYRDRPPRKISHFVHMEEFNILHLLRPDYGLLPKPSPHVAEPHPAVLDPDAAGARQAKFDLHFRRAGPDSTIYLASVYNSLRTEERPAKVKVNTFTQYVGSAYPLSPSSVPHREHRTVSLPPPPAEKPKHSSRIFSPKAAAAATFGAPMVALKMRRTVQRGYVNRHILFPSTLSPVSGRSSSSRKPWFDSEQTPGKAKLREPGSTKATTMRRSVQAIYPEEPTRSQSIIETAGGAVGNIVRQRSAVNMGGIPGGTTRLDLSQYMKLAVGMMRDKPRPFHFAH